MSENAAGTEAPKVEVAETISLAGYLERIRYIQSPHILLNIFAKNGIFEIRQACLRQLRSLLQYEAILVDQNADLIEGIIKRLLGMSCEHVSGNEFAHQLLELYIFHRASRLIKRSINFALDLLKINYVSLRFASKIVCGRLNDYCPNECFDDQGELKTNIYEVLPAVKTMLQHILDSARGHGLYPNLTKDRPYQFSDFCLLERALKTIVIYREHDQCFLPAITILINMYYEGTLVFDCPPGQPFEAEKNIAVLKKAAKILRQAEKQAQKK